jgi:hypothetical protein
MATYTPKDIVPVTALTATPGTSVFTGTAAHIYIVRTWHFSTSAAGKTVTASFGADAAGTRVFDAVALTQNVPSIYNGWWVFAGAGAHDIDANASATTAQIKVGGYDYA